MRVGVLRELAGDALAERVTELRPQFVRRYAARNPQLGADEVDDIYGQVLITLLERDPPASFGSEWALRAWLGEAMRRTLLHHGRTSTAQWAQSVGHLGDRGPAAGGGARPGDLFIEPRSHDFTPEQHALISEEHAALTEYIAGLRVEDRKVALLWLWPSSQLTAKSIAALLEMPLGDVRAAIHRVSTDFRRYSALSASGVCRRHMRRLERWRHDGGELPLALRLHARRCSICRTSIEQSRQRAYDALLPLVPGFAAPLVVGLRAQLAGAAGGAVHAAVAVAKRLIPATKEGAGSAIVAGKGATIAVVTAATVAAGAAGTVVVTHAGHHRPPRRAAVAVATPTTIPVVPTVPVAPVVTPSSPPTSTTAPSLTTTSTTSTSSTRSTTTSTVADPAPSVAHGSANDPSPAGATPLGGGGGSSFTPSGSTGGASVGLSPTGKTPSAP